MPKTLNKTLSIRRIRQISDSHCGPAVVQMLLQQLKIAVTQKQITKYSQAGRTIKWRGTRIDQLALAVNKLAPLVKLWYKDHGEIDDLIKLTEQYQCPVGIEWQGLFDRGSTRQPDEDGDFGHYSIVTYVDVKKKRLTIVDPYKDFPHNRYIKIEQFLPRWWDINVIAGAHNGKKTSVKDRRMFFIITPRTATFPLRLKMKNY